MREVTLGGRPHLEFEGVTCVRDTEKAILCVIEGVEVWIPLSQVHDDSEVFSVGDEGMLIITEWIAKEKDLI